MPKIVHRDTILKQTNDKPPSDRTYSEIQEVCGKDKNIRKSLYGLLKKGEIEIDGYDFESEPKGRFKLSNITFKKTESDYTNPIQVKGLLDEPLKDENYSKIQKLFKKRIEEINSIYHQELDELKEIEDLIPLADAINDGHIKEEDVYRNYPLDEMYDDPDIDHGIIIQEELPSGEPRFDYRITYRDVLKKDPEAKIYCLKKNFISKLAAIDIIIPKFPYFGNSRNRRIVYDHRIKSDSFHTHHNFGSSSFSSDYYRHLSHLPINIFNEQTLFNYFVIGAIRSEENREDKLWTLANDLTDKHPYNFAEKLRIIDEINAYIESDQDFRILKF